VPAGPLRLRAELMRTLSTLDGEIQRGLDRGVLAPEEVHNVHRDLRRLASGMAVWGRLVPTGRASTVEEVARRLRRLARLVGRVRDRDVTTALFAPVGRRPPPNGSDRWIEFLGRLRDDTQTGRELLLAFLRSERQGGLFERAGELLQLVPRADASRGLHRILADERRQRQGRVRKAHRKARRRPTSERLHRLRIRIRQWRHLASLELAARATANHPPPPSWQRLQGRLGRLHDLDVALATVPEDLVDADPPRRLRERRRALRRSVRASLERIAAGPERATARARLRGPR
jgi:CHAD domain-containing protein